MSAAADPWQVLALRYAENADRRRADSFLMAARPGEPHPMDFYFWVLRRGTEVIVVDTGMTGAEGQVRNRPILEEPAGMLARIGIAAEEVQTLVLTHLHFDHAGSLGSFPNAQVHLQASELAFATGPMMVNPTLRMPYSAQHLQAVVGLLHEGRVTLHEGHCDIAPGVTGHLIGGHAAGLMALSVETERGRLILASDVAHYYESVLSRPIFQIVVDPPAMVRGYDWLWREAEGDLARILPAHDPAIRHIYPERAPRVHDLSAEPGPALHALKETGRC